MSVCIDCAQQQKRRGSKVQDDEEEDVVKYFKVKPENQVVKLGAYVYFRPISFFNAKYPSVHTTNSFRARKQCMLTSK